MLFIGDILAITTHDTFKGGNMEYQDSTIASRPNVMFVCIEHTNTRPCGMLLPCERMIQFSDGKGHAFHTTWENYSAHPETADTFVADMGLAYREIMWLPRREPTFYKRVHFSPTITPIKVGRMKDEHGEDAGHMVVGPPIAVRTSLSHRFVQC